jgi:hypothetical protein
MQITPETLKVLENLATINPNLVIKPGSKIQTINEAKSILATSNVSEKFDTEVGIYDLSNFLSALSLIEKPDLEFSTQSILISGNKAKLNYRCANISILTKPEKELKMPPIDVSFTLKKETLDNLRKASSTLGHKILSFEGTTGGKITAVILDPADASANSFSLTLDEKSDSDFSFHFLISNLKLLEGDYKVEISKKLISHWVNTNNTIEYWLALEKTSKVG